MTSSTHSLIDTSPTSSNIPPGSSVAVGFFAHLSDAEYAVTALRSVGFPLGQMRLIANQFLRHDCFAGVKLCDRFAVQAMGIPAEQARFYQEQLEGGAYMMLMHGTAGELNQAASILNHRGIKDWQIYEAKIASEQPDTAQAANVSTAVTSSLGGTSPDQPHQAIGFFAREQDAEQATTDLRMAGFPLGQVLVVAQRLHQPEQFTGIDLRDRFDNSRFGFPQERVRFFNNRIARGNCLISIYGTPEQLQQAEVMLQRSHIDDFGIYELPKITDAQPNTEGADGQPGISANSSGEPHWAADIDRGQNDGSATTEPHSIAVVAQREENCGNS